MTWKINPDPEMKKEFLATLGEAGISRQRDLINKCGVDKNAASRFLHGENVFKSTIIPIFVYLGWLKRVIDDGTEDTADFLTFRPSKKDLIQAEALLRIYCLPTPDTADAEQSASMSTDKVAYDKPPLTDEARDGLPIFLAYYKFIHLQDEGGMPAYRREGPQEAVDVFTEYMVVQTLQLAQWAGGTTFRQSAGSGIVDSQPIFPLNRDLSEYNFADMAPAKTAQRFTTNTRPIGQMVFTVVNGFSRERETLGTVLTIECDRVVIVVDMTSLPIAPLQLFTSSPTASHTRGQRTVQMSCEQPRPGIFCTDSGRSALGAWHPETHSLLPEDEIQLRLPVRWSAISSTVR